MGGVSRRTTTARTEKGEAMDKDYIKRSDALEQLKSVDWYHVNRDGKLGMALKYQTTLFDARRKNDE